MKRFLLGTMAVCAALTLASMPVRASGPELSPQRLNLVDRLGYFTPTFKKAVHDLVNAKQAVVDAKADEQKLSDELPDLEKQVAQTDGTVEGLRKQFSDLEHIDESDFAALQKKMGAPDPTVDLQKQLADAVGLSETDFVALKKKVGEANDLLEQQRVLAQGYVWAYPANPNQSEAQKDLQTVQQKTTDLSKELADAEAARVAAHAKLVQRALAKDLSIVEWRDFLLNTSKEDLLKLLGPPQSYSLDNWNYTGSWTQDAVTKQKVGLVINFNAGRVMNVSEASP